ncbi:hypothetical protein EDD90_4759 [Streptomyces sp. Ag109_O5-1]|uniref:hypothetical protein n=1 Tax=Streptomyces sp. Ag109_O5-1 TaxID=1938851 RepID=UPI000F5107D3|nr:hypothetical protein [Streptomyces sp. Ag109_O5-1]RPE41668.1 hypothetical protein EDD90_4759 [Streptomyces sp. Ag109_O5-1]
MSDEVSRNAFDDPGTLRAWQRARRRSITATTLWILSLPGFFVLETITWESLTGGSLPVYIMVLPILISAVGVGVSDSRRVQLKEMRRILAVYPWQDHPPLKNATPADINYLKLPDPDDRAKYISVVVRRYGLTGKHWRSALSNARTRGFMFAGDPRFAAVVALRGVDELGMARPTHVLAPARGARPDGVSEPAWLRARAAGISGESAFSEEELRQLESEGK